MLSSCSIWLWYAFEVGSVHFGRGNVTTIPNLSQSKLRELPIPTPPLDEQRKIAAVLGLVQRAIEQQERLIALTTELKKALLHKLFAEGLRGEPQKQTEIGPVPESWEVVSLKTLLAEPVRNGHSARATNDGGGIRTLTLTAVTRRDFSAENTKLTCADPERVNGLWLKNGDILVERANTPEYVGLAALYEGPDDFAIFPDLMIRVRVDDTCVDPFLVAEYLVTPAPRRYFQKNAHSTAGNFPKIDQATVENVLVPLPRRDEQSEMVTALRVVDGKRQVHTRRSMALRDLFRVLLHQLMTAQIRVGDLDIDAIANLGSDEPPNSNGEIRLASGAVDSYP
jgi:type I restriction enzyme S subunit